MSIMPLATWGSLDKNELLESILGLLAHAKTETSQRHSIYVNQNANLGL